MIGSKLPLLGCAAVLLLGGLPVRAQDMAGGREPIVASIDLAALKYDYLVDGDLPQDDLANRKFKTLQAAYAAAPAGTEAKPTVIGIKPNVYQLTGGDNGPSLAIAKNWITLLGLTNNRRSVVLADNRGHSQGATDNGYIINVNATGFTAKNLTILNYCNTDYEYPGNPEKNLKKRSDVITQAVSFQSDGDKLVLENVALLSRLDTMFLRSQRSYFKDVYIEGTDDFIGGGQFSVWEDCTIVFPTGRGVMSASQIAFLNCKFEAARGLQFYKSEFGSGARPVALINCTMPVSSPQSPVAWVRGKAAPRPNLYSLTYRIKDSTGKPATICDSTLDTSSFTYSRELSDQEAAAFNPWNILRGNDDWDPAGVKGRYESAGQGSSIFRMALTGANPSIRTGAAGATIGAAVMPNRAADKSVKWSTTSPLVSLATAPDGSAVVTGHNTTDRPEYVPITATASNGFYVSTYVFVEPAYISPPTIKSAPTIDPPSNGAIAVNYALDLGGREDQSVITWSLCNDASGSNAREVAVSRGNAPLKTFTLTPGAIGKYIRVTIRPKHQISDPGEAVSAISSSPIATADLKSMNISLKFRNFVEKPSADYVSGLWTVLGTWTVETGEKFVDGYGIRVGSAAASLLYQQNAPCGDMQIDLVMTPEKTEGMGFGSPGSPADGDRVQKSDIFIKYDPRTKNGYSLRYWRTTRSAQKCMYQLYKIENGVGSPLNDQQLLSGVFKQNTHMTLNVAGNKFSASASNDIDQEKLSLEATIIPNSFGGAGVYWGGSVPRGNSNAYSQINILYPKN